jgi:hypothetical protein
MKTDNKPEQKTGSNRRKFLVGATLGSAGAVAAAVVGGMATDVITTAAVEPAKKPKGYHETDHIRQYYETTRI